MRAPENQLFVSEQNPRQIYSKPQNARNMLSMSKWRVQVSAAAAHVDNDNDNDKTLQHQEHKLIYQSHLRYLLAQVRGKERNNTYRNTGRRAGENWEKANRDMSLSWSVTIQIHGSKQRTSNSSVTPLLIDRWRWRFSPLTLQAKKKKIKIM